MSTSVSSALTVEAGVLQPFDDPAFQSPIFAEEKLQSSQVAEAVLAVAEAFQPSEAPAILAIAEVFTPFKVSPVLGEVLREFDPVTRPDNHAAAQLATSYDLTDSLAVIGDICLAEPHSRSKVDGAPLFAVDAGDAQAPIRAISPVNAGQTQAPVRAISPVNAGQTQAPVRAISPFVVCHTQTPVRAISQTDDYPAEGVCFTSEKDQWSEIDLTPSLYCGDSTNTGQEVVYIPRPKVFTANMHVFSDLGAFCNATGFVPTSAPVKMKSKMPNILKQVRALGSMLGGIKRKVTSKLNGGKPKDTHSVKDKPALQLFSYKTVQTWRGKKKELISEMYKHQDSLIVLREARKACWKSEGKLIVATQKCSDRQNQMDVDVRQKALKKLESILERKQVKHQQNVETFMESSKNEFTLRKSVLEQAQRLESLILAEMEAAITRLMNTNRQDISAEQVADFARLIYGKTSRAYCFKNVLPEPCLKERVSLSTFDTSRINRKGMLRLSA